MKHILLTKADSCCRFIFMICRLFLTAVSIAHRAGFILSLAHIGTSPNVYIRPPSVSFISWMLFRHVCFVCRRWRKQGKSAIIWWRAIPDCLIPRQSFECAALNFKARYMLSLFFAQSTWHNMCYRLFQPSRICHAGKYACCVASIFICVHFEQQLGSSKFMRH